jgi:hypothetical protein
VKLICKVCDQLKDETEFDWWFPAIKVRKEICKECEKRELTRWMIKELEKQNKKKPNVSFQDL